MDDRRGSRLEASIGLSRKWDAREAGREVTKSAIKKLSQPPSFFLLFSTIHYKDHGGFQEFLNGVWDVLPEETPLIGGTVACFINNYGFYARGATALAVSYPNIDVTLGVGRHTIRNPKKAARNCARMIQEGLNKSNYENKFLVNVLPGPTIPKVPIIGRVQTVKSKFFGWLATYIGARIFPFLGYGWGREEDVINHLTSYLHGYYILGGSVMDDYKQTHSYQFIKNNVHTDSIIALASNVDLPIFLRSTTGLHETDKTFEISSTTFDGRIITKINNRPAKEQILKALRIAEEQIRDFDSLYYRISNYFPITFEDNKKYMSGVGGFFGDNVVLGYKAGGKKAILLSITGKEAIDVIDNIFHDFNIDLFPFVFMSSSAIVINLLGSEVYKMKSKLDDYVKETPYLMICPINENAGTPDEPAVARVYSFNALSILNKDNI